MKDRTLAAWLHENYEEIAADEGWDTQEETSVAFDDLPETNRRVMLRLARRLQHDLALRLSDSERYD